MQVAGTRRRLRRRRPPKCCTLLPSMQLGVCLKCLASGFSFQQPWFRAAPIPSACSKPLTKDCRSPAGMRGSVLVSKLNHCWKMPWHGFVSKGPLKWSVSFCFHLNTNQKGIRHFQKLVQSRCSSHTHTHTHTHGCLPKKQDCTLAAAYSG